jgi:hypothetical protein
MRAPMRRPDVFSLTIAALGFAALGLGVAGGSEPPKVADRAAGHHERLNDPPAAADDLLQLKRAPAPTIVERNGHVSVQVNVGQGGVNIVGDAANEPSIAVDPGAPLRVAVGWRQFDSIASDFREGGWSWSADGGRSWAPVQVLENNVFRSDPVLTSDAEGRFYYYSLISTPEIFCSLFLSDDRGETWQGPIDAFGGDKAWFTIDTSSGPGRGNIYVGWATASNQFGRRTFIRSFDGGVTFTEPIATEPTPTWGTLAVGLDGELFVVGNAHYDRDRFVVFRSFDVADPDVEPPAFDLIEVDLGGAQRTGGEFPLGSPNPAGLTGQVWIDIDRSQGPNRGDLYIVSSVEPTVGSDPMDVHFVRSTDGGATWSEPVAIHTDDRRAWQWFATMSVAPNGRIDVVWVESLDNANPNVGELYYTASWNGGITWSEPEAVTPVFDSWLGWPRQDKMGDYFHMVSDDVGAHLAYAATFNGEQDVYYLRIGDTDCNGNGIGDLHDLASGWTDCNTNGLVDRCEIAAGTADDSDGDGFIDECRLPSRRARGRLTP